MARPPSAISATAFQSERGPDFLSSKERNLALLNADSAEQLSRALQTMYSPFEIRSATDAFQAFDSDSAR